jgi:hypothetical protein
MELRDVIADPSGVGDVYAMLTDEAFWRAVAHATHALRSSVSVRAEAGGAVVHVVRTMPARVPAVVQALVGSEIEIDQTERWSAAGPDGRRTAELLLVVPGKPVRFPGRMTLENTADGSRQTVTGRIEVRLPMGGAAIAAEIAKAIRAAMTVQRQVAGLDLRGASGHGSSPAVGS